VETFPKLSKHFLNCRKDNYQFGRLCYQFGNNLVPKFINSVSIRRIILSIGKFPETIKFRNCIFPKDSKNSPKLFRNSDRLYLSIRYQFGDSSETFRNSPKKYLIAMNDSRWILADFAVTSTIQLFENSQYCSEMMSNNVQDCQVMSNDYVQFCPKMSENVK